jgi:hypothetical protein
MTLGSSAPDLTSPSAKLAQTVKASPTGPSAAGRAAVALTGRAGVANHATNPALPSIHYPMTTPGTGCELHAQISEKDSDTRQFSVETGVEVYFCDPRSPWQRGSNENTNGLLRQYFPKGKSLASVTQAELDEVACKLNDRPRQTLGFRTPAEKLTELIDPLASALGPSLCRRRLNTDPPSPVEI